jgi:lysophospholipase L1-like esterase
MLECLIIGDSIGVGVSQFRPECAAYVQSGITSEGWIQKWGEKPEDAKIVIISLGANDYTVDTLTHIKRIRKNIEAQRVIWLLPRPERVPIAFNAVYEVARQFNDIILERPKNTSPDRIHPTAEGYKELADKTKLYR